MSKPSIVNKFKSAYREARQEAVVQNMLVQIRTNQQRIKHKELDIQCLLAENQRLSHELASCRNSSQ